jgi:tetratricopeptide (TPR) repeat protein
MRCTARALFLCVIVSLCGWHVAAAEILTNEAVVTMVKAGLGDDVIVGKVRLTQGQYDLSTNGLLRLKADGVSEAVIKAMIEASAGGEAPGPKPAQAATPPAEVARREAAAVALYKQGKMAEAAVAFDRLIAEKPDDAGLRVWKALTLLEQAREIKDNDASGFKPLVMNAYAILQPLKPRLGTNADWNFAMAKAFWLNGSPTWASRAAGTALRLQTNFPEAQLLLGDLAYDSEASSLAQPPGSPARENALRWAGALPRKEINKVLTMPDLPPSLRAEALYKLGVIAAEFERKPEVAREHWERAVAADPACRYGRMAQRRLQTPPGK